MRKLLLSVFLRAALMMGINRGTLRKKLKKYGMN